MSKSNKLVFFGSGPVAETTLEGLVKAGFSIEAIITKPRPVHHRGIVPVLEFARAHKITAYAPGNKQELAELFSNAQFKSQVGLVVDYGIVIPKNVIDAFKMGILNSHFSLLPQWRGADPITFALLSGQEATGVSLMLIEPALDTGKLLAQVEYKISPDETITSLTKNLTELSNHVLKEILPIYLSGKLILFNQDPHESPTYSRKLTKQDGLIDWGKPAIILEREVRSYLGWPKSRSNLFGHEVIITKVRIAKSKDDGHLVVKCNPGWLEILELITPNGRTTSGADFLRGYNKKY